MPPRRSSPRCAACSPTANCTAPSPTLSIPRSADILRQYALHLKDAELLAVAAATPGMAGRDLKDVCEQAERRWASKVGAPGRPLGSGYS